MTRPLLARLAALAALLLCGIAAKAQNALIDSLFIADQKPIFEAGEESRRDAERCHRDFAAAYYSAAFDDDDRAAIREIAGNINVTRKAAYANYKRYVDALLAFAAKSGQRANFKAFNQMLRGYCLDHSVTLSRIANYLVGVSNLVGGRMLFDTPMTRWTTSDDNYTLEPDGDRMKVKLRRVTLTCYAQHDSIMIHGTSGEFHIAGSGFAGDGGRVTWEKSGFAPDTVYATFGPYTLDLNRSMLQVDTALFYNYTYFREPIEGSLRYQAARVETASAVRFPRFESFQKRFRLEGLYEHIDYTGGYVQHGSQFIGQGSREEPATLDFWKRVRVVERGDTVERDIVFLRARSESFTFTKDRVSSGNAVTAMYLDEDSIYHPGLTLQYYVETQKINLLRTEDPTNMSRSPYFDSYHMVEIRAELVEWDMNGSEITFTKLVGSDIGAATFESYNYFAADRYARIQSTSTVHPLAEIRRYSRQIKSETFTADDLARHMGMADFKVRQLLLSLSFDGYLYYDRESHVATLRQKTFDYLQAAARRKDYDVIQISSRTTGRQPNAVLDLRNLDLRINGVPEFNFSQANHVMAEPSGQQLTLKRNRRIDFGGALRVGLYEYYGKRFAFDYESFTLDLEDVDYMEFHTPTGVDAAGYYELRKVDNRIEDIDGRVYIAHPGNKSGNAGNKRYPIFESGHTSYMYYDKTSRQGELYDRDSIHFEIDPYTIDSMDVVEAEPLKLKGRFHSGNILPVIEETLTLQGDLSMGFSHDLGQEGAPIYGGVGNVSGTVDVSNSGIRTRGAMRYRNTTTWSDEFVYYLDSAHARATRFENAGTRRPSLPTIRGQKLDIHLHPYADSLVGHTRGEAAKIFDAQAQLSGTFTLLPASATAKGTLEAGRSTLASAAMDLGNMTATAAVANWRLRSKTLAANTIEVDRAQARLDFDARLGEFAFAGEQSAVELPANHYRAYADGLRWEMDRERALLASTTTRPFDPRAEAYFHGGGAEAALKAAMEKALQGEGEQVEAIEGVEGFDEALRQARLAQMAQVESPYGRHATTRTPPGSLFVSTDIHQDSLHFAAPKAEIDLERDIITASEVEHIDVADATIYPGDKRLTIEPEARHRTLRGARVAANRTTRHHTVHDANITISGRRHYTGSGLYDYVDQDQKPWTIRMTVVGVDEQSQTSYARGEVAERDNLALSPAFAFRGKVAMQADERDLEFDGDFKLLKQPAQLARHWVPFQSPISPADVRIPVKETNRDSEQATLSHSVATSYNPDTTYTTFLTPAASANRHLYTATPGLVRYDNTLGEYQISSDAKLDNPQLPDNIVTLNTENGNFRSQGTVDIMPGRGLVGLQSRGTMTENAERREILAGLFATFDFHFNDANLQMIADTLNTIKSISANNTLAPSYEAGMADLVGASAARQLIEEQRLFGVPKELPAGYRHTLVLTDLNMQWDTADAAWKSFGKIGVGHILETQVNKMVEGMVEFRNTRQGQQFFIYLEPAPGLWYFFKYTQSSMLSVSSEPAYNKALQDLKISKRKLKSDEGKYTYYLSYPRVKDEAIFYFKGGKAQEGDAGRGRRRGR